MRIGIDTYKLWTHIKTVGTYKIVNSHTNHGHIKIMDKHTTHGETQTVDTNNKIVEYTHPKSWNYTHKRDYCAQNIQKTHNHKNTKTQKHKRTYSGTTEFTERTDKTHTHIQKTCIPLMS